MVKDPAAFKAKYGQSPPVAGQYSGRLANDGERIELVDAVGTTIHTSGTTTMGTTAPTVPGTP